MKEFDFDTVIFDLSYGFSKEVFFKSVHTLSKRKEPLDSEPYNLLWKLAYDSGLFSGTKIHTRKDVLPELLLISDFEDKAFYLLDCLYFLGKFKVIERFSFIHALLDAVFSEKRLSFKPFYNRYGSFFEQTLFDVLLTKGTCLKTKEEEKDYNKYFEEKLKVVEQFLYLDKCTFKEYLYERVPHEKEEFIRFMDKLDSFFETKDTKYKVTVVFFESYPYSTRYSKASEEPSLLNLPESLEELYLMVENILKRNSQSKVSYSVRLSFGKPEFISYNDFVEHFSLIFKNEEAYQMFLTEKRIEHIQ